MPPDPGLPETRGRWIAEPAWPRVDGHVRTWHLAPGRLADRPEDDAALTLSSPP